MVEIKTDAGLDGMREAGRVVAEILRATSEAAAVGVTLRELDEVAREVLREAGATSPFLNYRPTFAQVPFPATICTSVNDAVVHGVPDGYRLRDGDLLSIDCGATLDGWSGDAAVSLCVGTPRPEDEVLLKTTRSALEAGIAAALAGGRMGDISHAVGTLGRGAGFGILDGFGGHGIGRAMHEDPPVPNEGRPGRGFRLRHGLALAIEPMLIAGGGDSYRTAPDGWTLKTTDGSRAAHFEHSVAITDDGPRILTAP